MLFYTQPQCFETKETCHTNDTKKGFEKIKKRFDLLKKINIIFTRLKKEKTGTP